jgi:acyl carrier protein
MFVEETFGVSVKDEDIVPENFDSVAQLAHYVQLRMGETAPEADERVSVD